MRSRTKWAHAPSITPVAMGYPAVGERFRVVEVGPLVLQVPGALVGPPACRCIGAQHGGRAPDRSGNDPGLCLQDRQCLLGDEGLPLGSGLSVTPRYPKKRLLR